MLEKFSGYSVFFFYIIHDKLLKYVYMHSTMGPMFHTITSKSPSSSSDGKSMVAGSMRFGSINGSPAALLRSSSR